MIKANSTIFNFYLLMMDFFSEYLLHKYSESSLNILDHYKTIIIQKIVRMFHTLNILTKDTKDEVSARCVLRGILDSVTTYCFIYQREDEEELLFRHYLYVLDGCRSYKKYIIENTIEKNKADFFCDNIINQIEEQINNHSYLKRESKTIRIIVKNANWKYISLHDTNKLSYYDMYRQIGFEDKTTNYLHGYLSQYAHGLCLSNTLCVDSKQIYRVLYESITLADRMVQAICNTFPKDELTLLFLRSDTLQKLLDSKEFNSDDLAEFASALVQNDKTLLI